MTKLDVNTNCPAGAFSHEQAPGLASVEAVQFGRKRPRLRELRQLDNWHIVKLRPLVMASPMSDLQSRTVRMPKLASIPTQRELRLMVRRCQAEGREIEQSWRLAAHPNSYQLRVRAEEDSTVVWTLREVDGVESREVWSAKTDKLVVVRAAAARICKIDLPGEDEEESTPEELAETEEKSEELTKCSEETPTGFAEPTQLLEECQEVLGKTQESVGETSKSSESALEAEVCNTSYESAAPRSAESSDSHRVLTEGDLSTDDDCTDSVEDDWKELEAMGEAGLSAALLAKKMIDPETGLYSQAGLIKLLEHEFHRFDAQHTPLSLMVVEIANQDRPLSNKALSDASIRIDLVRRRLDLAGYLGAGKLALVLPRTGPHEASVVAQHVLELLSAKPLGEADDSIKTGIGIASLPSDGRLLKDLIDAATQAAAKARSIEGTAAVCTAQEIR
jgi:GGDEF domain-containing protein